jgi:TPP-dependent trihydroxycyclohexane-1,2-dione (THcHDO) dehydratase
MTPEKIDEMVGRHYDLVAELTALKIELENMTVALSEVREMYAESYIANTKLKAELAALKTERDTWKDRAENATAAWAAVIQKHTETLERFAALKTDARYMAEFDIYWPLREQREARSRILLATEEKI